MDLKILVSPSGGKCRVHEGSQHYVRLIEAGWREEEPESAPVRTWQEKGGVPGEDEGEQEE